VQVSKDIPPHEQHHTFCVYPRQSIRPFCRPQVARRRRKARTGETDSPLPIHSDSSTSYTLAIEQGSIHRVETPCRKPLAIAQPRQLATTTGRNPKHPRRINLILAPNKPCVAGRSRRFWIPSPLHHRHTFHKRSI
jgi:hypothetical protein